MQELTIVPYGGLANRMRAMNSAIEYTRTADVPLNVIWFSNRELNADFSDLFLPPSYSDNQTITIKQGTFLNRFLYRSPRRHTLWLPKFIAPLRFDTRIYSKEFVRLQQEGKLEKAIDKGKRVLIESCHEFGQYQSALSRNFIPCPDILTAVDEYVDKYFSPRTIGIHVRRTDNTLAIEQSPLSLFIDSMHREIEQCAETNFYVASDDISCKEELRSIFGERILTIDTVCNRESIAGMKDAVKEMWILSRTCKIYGCFYSSYAVIASQLSDIPLHILQL